MLLETSVLPLVVLDKACKCNLIFIAAKDRLLQCYHRQATVRFAPQDTNWATGEGVLAKFIHHAQQASLGWCRLSDAENVQLGLARAHLPLLNVVRSRRRRRILLQVKLGCLLNHWLLLWCDSRPTPTHWRGTYWSWGNGRVWVQI